MHVKSVTLWGKLCNRSPAVHETKWTPRVKGESDVGQSYTSSDIDSIYAISIIFSSHYYNIRYRIDPFMII